MLYWCSFLPPSRYKFSGSLPPWVSSCRTKANFFCYPVLHITFCISVYCESHIF